MVSVEFSLVLLVVVACINQNAAQVAMGHLGIRTGNAIGDGVEHCDKCDDNALCEYRGQTHDGMLQFECVCKPGHDGDGLHCSAPDPCEHNTCDSNASCRRLGSDGFACDCNKGFTGDGFKCVDADECANLAVCPLTSKCVNSVGSYECVCNAGYQHPLVDGDLDKFQCIDIDECGATPSPCPNDSKCTNTAGSYYCDCSQGYVRSSDGLSCVDLDECTQITPHPCDSSRSKCNNLSPGYECVCDEGYIHLTVNDKVTCHDVDECLDGATNSCPGNSRCFNTIGSFQCLCKDGFEMSADGSSCNDIDECAATIDPCDTNRSTCKNLAGDYECTCLPGYTHAIVNNKICADDDECADGSQTCSMYATCDNTVGGYNCTCFYGFTGDGHTCTEVSPTLKELEDNLDNLTNTQLLLKLYVAYYDHLHLQAQLERVNRLCPLIKAGLLDTLNRSKRDIQADINELIGGDMDRKLALQTLLHKNSEIALRISLRKRECNVELKHPKSL